MPLCLVAISFDRIPVAFQKRLAAFLETRLGADIVNLTDPVKAVLRDLSVSTEYAYLAARSMDEHLGESVLLECVKRRVSAATAQLVVVTGHWTDPVLNWLQTEKAILLRVTTAESTGSKYTVKYNKNVKDNDIFKSVLRCIALGRQTTKIG